MQIKISLNSDNKGTNITCNFQLVIEVVLYLENGYMKILKLQRETVYFHKSRNRRYIYIYNLNEIKVDVIFANIKSE